MVPLLYLVVFLALTGHSSATYCLCKDGVSEQVLQKTLDYACGAGADCSPINQNGACYNPNTVKDHCNYAVNSYFQKKGQAQGSCDFSGTVTVGANPPPNVPSSCSFPSSSSSSTPTTPTMGTPPTTPSMGTPPTTPTMGTPPTTPTMGTPPTNPTPCTPTTPSTGTNSGSTNETPVFVGGGSSTLGPTGTTTGFADPNRAVSLFTSTINILFTSAITLWIVVGCSWI